MDKMEATKLIMQFLAQQTNKQSLVESKILEANPVLEAFSNATTIHNNNSSHFVHSTHTKAGGCMCAVCMMA